MAIGMTYEQYWYGDPLMVRAFYKAFQLRQEQIDEQAWLNGVYVLRALDATVGNMFRKHGATPAEYPQEPMTLTSRRQREAEASERRKAQEAVWARAWMESFVQAGKNFGKNKKQEG